jgi:hypothetical protein
MKLPLRSFLALVFLAGVARAEVTAVTYDFDDSVNNGEEPAYEGTGYWHNVDGWTTTTSGGYFYVSDTNSSDGSNYIRFTDSGSGVGATASIADTFGTVSTDEKFSFSFSYLSENYWGTLVGIGAGASQGITLEISNYFADGPVRLRVGSLLLADGDIDFDLWEDFRVDVDLAANSGAGSASVFARGTGALVWSGVTGLSNVNLGLDVARSAGDSTNPLNWNTLWFHQEGATSGIDNIAVTSVPEPSQMLVAMALLLLVVARSRRARASNR